MTRLMSRFGLWSLPLGLAALTLLVPVQAHDHRIAGALPLCRYACGARILQVYSHPSAANRSEDKQFLTDAGFQLRPRMVTRIRSADARLRAPTDRLTIHEYDLYYHNLPVSQSSRTIVVNEGRTLAIRDRNLPVNLQKPSQVPDVSHEAAWGLAYQNSRETLAQLYHASAPRMTADTSPASTPRIVLWPDPREKKMHLAYNLTVRSTARNQPYIRRYWIAAHQPARILDYEDLVFYQAPARPPRNAKGAAAVPPTLVPSRTAATLGESSFTAVFPGNVSGTVTATMWETSPYGSVVTRALPGLEVAVARPGGAPQTATTDVNGQYQISGVQGLATVRVNLSGHACRIINDQTEKHDHALYSNRLGVGTVNVDFPARPGEEFKLAQTSAYYHVTSAFNFVREYVPDRPSKLYALKTHVNIDDSCNAYYDRSDTSLNFFRANGTECPNTAYRDVVYHEYGHAVDDELGGVMDGPYSEGFGDALSLLITRSPIVAQDFYGPGKHLRDSRKVVYWTQHKDGEIHTAGQIYAGFCWELTQQLQATYGPDRGYDIARQLIMGAAVQNPKDIPDAVRLSFFLDAQLYPSGRESRHAPQLRAAANSRQIPIPQDPRFLNSPLVMAR